MTIAINSKKISERRDCYGFSYSVCTLVTDLPLYKEMLDSFRKAGFCNADTEFLYIDNSQGNHCDAYRGLNKFINVAQGNYLIYCHQDILLNKDNRKDLDARILELDRIDANWAVLGNAGGAKNWKKPYLRITDPSGDDRKRGDLPQKVYSLDENFLLIKQVSNVAVSRNLSGYHLYGTDLCLVANFLGYSAYVIDFHLTHLSAGRVDARFAECRLALIDKYKKVFQAKFIRAPCTCLYLSGSVVKNTIFNKIYLVIAYVLKKTRKASKAKR